MKKYFTLFLFALALTFSTQNMSAQNQIDIDSAASQKTKLLQEAVKLDDSKMDDVFEAYKQYEFTYQRIENSLEKNAERLTKINTALDAQLKRILTKEQFEIYIKKYRAS